MPRYPGACCARCGGSIGARCSRSTARAAVGFTQPEPVVGTTTVLLENTAPGLAQGRMFQSGFEAVLGAAVDKAPQAPKFSYGLAAGAPAVGAVYSFEFEVEGQRQIASYTALTGDDNAAVRLDILNEVDGVWRCRTTFNCTDACPRGIQVTQAIQEVKRALMFSR